MLPCDDSIQKYRIVTRILKLMHGFFVRIQGLCNERHPRFSPYLVSLKFIGHFARTFILAIVPMSVPSFRPHLRFLLSIVSLNLTRSIAYRWKLSVFHEISIHRSSIAMVQYNIRWFCFCWCFHYCMLRVSLFFYSRSSLPGGIRLKGKVMTGLFSRTTLLVKLVGQIYFLNNCK